MKKNQLYLIAALALVLQLPALLASAQNETVVAYVTINTAGSGQIKGSSIVKGEEGTIECVGYSFTMKTTLNIGSQSSGAGAGKMSPITIQLVKHVDAASPTLMQMMMNGQAMSSLVIEVAKKNGEPTGTSQKIEFNLVAISQITEYAGAGTDKSNTVPDEQLTLEAEKVVLPAGTGTVGAATAPAVKYDVKTLKKQ